MQVVIVCSDKDIVWDTLMSKYWQLERVLEKRYLLTNELLALNVSDLKGLIEAGLMLKEIED